jgi:alpha/beta superfamily hydrolase
MSIVIFSHGKESGPHGIKIQLMAEIAVKHGHQTLSIDYTTCKDENERVDLLRENLVPYKKEKKILVGSSMGGYVCAVMATEIEVAGLFLLCPALNMPDYKVQTYTPKTTNIEIIHGWNDEVVPSQNSIAFAKQNLATLHLVDDNHRLSKSHKFLGESFDNFLEKNAFN